MGKAETSLRDRFATLLRTNPSFKFVLDDGKTWLCPYCGGAAVENRKAPEFGKLALRHLLTKCPRANGLRSKPMQAAQLKEVILFHRLKANYVSDPAWRVRIGGGGWLCPFCVQSTEVQLVGQNSAQRPVDDVVRDIRRHLTHCYSYWQNPSGSHSVDEIRSLTSERKKQDAVVQEITKLIQSDPVFQFSDKDGHWICPFCEKPVERVDFSTPLARARSAPRQAVTHLQSGSCTYQGGPLDPKKTAADMKRVKEGTKAPSAAPPETGTTRYLETLRSELHDLRSQVEDSQDLQRDLERARKAQRRMLPAAPPEIGGYDIDAYFLACDKVSGDFYDFIPLEDGRVGIVIGDVSGHGIDAGIVMGMTKKAFRLRAQSIPDPLAVAAKVNDDIFPELETTTFVTATYGILDPPEGVFRFVRCGHTFPVHYLAAPGEAREIRTEGMALGAMGGPAALEGVRPSELRMGPGDAIALFTDGLIEAATEEGEEFGAERLRDAILRHGPGSARCAIEGVIGAIHVFKCGSPQRDDHTLLLIRRKV